MLNSGNGGHKRRTLRGPRWATGAGRWVDPISEKPLVGAEINRNQLGLPAEVDVSNEVFF